MSRRNILLIILAIILIAVGAYLFIKNNNSSDPIQSETETSVTSLKGSYSIEGRFIVPTLDAKIPHKIIDSQPLFAICFTGDSNSSAINMLRSRVSSSNPDADAVIQVEDYQLNALNAGECHATAKLVKVISSVEKTVSTEVVSEYNNSTLGLTFLAPKGLTVSENNTYRKNLPRSYFITVSNPDSSYHARLWANSAVEFTMGPDDAVPSVSTSTVLISGIQAEKTLKHYPDTGSTELTLFFDSGNDNYYFDFPYTTDQDRIYSDAIIKTLKF